MKDRGGLEPFFVEHMEEDDPTPHALPRWVELEYKVSKYTYSNVMHLIIKDSTCARLQDLTRL